MSGTERIALLLLTKPFVYGWIYELLRRTLPARERPSGRRSAAAGLARAAAGLAFGIPAASLLVVVGPAWGTAAYFAVRALLWAGIAGLVFPLLPWRRGLLFGLGGAALNLVLDFTLVGGPFNLLRLSC